MDSQKLLGPSNEETRGLSEMHVPSSKLPPNESDITESYTTMAPVHIPQPMSNGPAQQVPPPYAADEYYPQPFHPHEQPICVVNRWGMWGRPLHTDGTPYTRKEIRRRQYIIFAIPLTIIIIMAIVIPVVVSKNFAKFDNDRNSFS